MARPVVRVRRPAQELGRGTASTSATRREGVSVPTAWTDASGEDPFVVLAAGRSPFRIEDLPALADLIDHLTTAAAASLRRRRDRLEDHAAEVGACWARDDRDSARHADWPAQIPGPVPPRALGPGAVSTPAPSARECCRTASVPRASSCCGPW
ncbi:DUF5372 family protein [Streptomyces albidoflavus]|uniref:DUF5372 family protein n=1 Tax=Streptomyces albidoflavus TaxID=1886 RepID=UPI0033A95F1F